MEKRPKKVISYDQAGNLVKTIPPAGIDDKHGDAVFLQQVKTARKNVQNGGLEINNKVVPSHSMVTQYRYNTLNQAVAQQSPDGGQTNFWYDVLGRLVVSRNAEQQLHKKYSYTLYDAIGRITEVGQKPQTVDPPAKNPDLLQKWLEEDPNREQITRTQYDLSYGNDALKDFIVQRNLRNRVSYSQVFDKEPDPNVLGTHQSATYYSYDVLGNVDTLLQDYNFGEMKSTGNRFKKLVYDYDLISGKVNKVSYQPGQSDEFYHNYLYDAENRLTDVYTSKDKLSWERDSRYSYYKHGPLAKTILGQNQVQGMDYAYTLQGWLKGVNSTNMAPPVNNVKVGDMGGDGYGQNNQVARDAFGFALHYYSTANSKDYKPIQGSLQPFANAAAAGFGFVPLYNGNIAAMSVNLPKVGEPLLYTYKYDQLNRLTKSNTYKGLNPNTNNWNVVSIDDYREELTYDANGNILTYKRNGFGNKLDMDKMTYQYPKTPDGKNINNRLRYVHDEVSAANYSEDIDSQTPLTLAQVKAEKLPEQQSDNYVYDAIGNLIQDKKEGINKITWNVYGKIASIEKQNSTITYQYDASGNRISKMVGNALTMYTRDASGNVLNTYVKNDTINNGNLTQSEVYLYGSSRLGVARLNRDVHKLGTADNLDKVILDVVGLKGYELTNHLGNVMGVVSDKKHGVDVNNDGIIDYYTADVIFENDYAPFGMEMPGRSYAGGYRYGYNGQMKDHAIDASGNHYTALYWEYSSPTGRRWNLDPKPNPSVSPYATFENNPIWHTDPLGDTIPKDYNNYRMDYKPVFNSSSIGEGVGNAVSNVGAFLWNGTFGAALGAAQSIGNGIAGMVNGDKDNSPPPMVAFDQWQTNAYKYHTQTPIRQQGADLLSAATNLQNYEILPQLIIAHKLSIPSSPTTTIINTESKLMSVSFERFAGGSTYASYGDQYLGRYQYSKAKGLELDLNIPANLQSKGLGTQIFSDAIKSTGANKFTATWIKSSDYATGASINLQRYQAALKTMSPEKAAFQTWSGQQAAAHGFKNVSIKSIQGGTGIEATFTK